MKFRFSVMVLAGLLLSGCCLMINKKEVNISGDKVSSHKLGKIEIGKTSQTQVTALLGAPTIIHKYEEDPAKQIWTYDFTKRTERTSMFILIWLNKEETIESETVTIEFDDGIVKKVEKDIS